MRGKEITVLKVPFHPVDMEGALEEIAGFIISGRPHQVVTANPEMVMAALKDGELMQILTGAELVVADGIGIVWAARRLGTPLPERVPGVELAAAALSLAAENGYRVYLLGGAPGVAAKAARRLVHRYPGLEVVGVQHGYFTPGEEEEVAARIAAASPHLLLVGLGMGKQEKWIHRHRQSLGVPVSMGVGGSLDVFAGRVRRAPAWVCRLGLEWFYRLLLQPRRLPRMLALPKFVLRVLREAGP